MINPLKRRVQIMICSVTIITLCGCGQAAPVAPPPPTTTSSPAPTRITFSTVTVAPSATPDPFPSPVLKIVGEEEIVFDWSKDRCEAADIPDLPARAFRDDQGNVQLIASHYVSRRFIGSDLNTVKRDCKAIMRSASREDPSLFAYHEWLAAPYTDDGKTIYALVHNEYYGSKAYIPCSPAFAGDPACWYNAITLAVSDDSGASYHPAAEPPDHLIASSLSPYEANAGPYGFFEPSNIIKGKDGYYYAFLREHFPHGGNQASICIMRTDDLSDASSWRAWDGENFTISFVNPYKHAEEASSAQECASIPLDNLGIMSSSVTFNTYLNRYVMVGDTAIHISGREVWGILYSFSDDLIHWQPRKLLAEVELPWTYQPGDADYYHYPSLLDPDSPSRNFDVTGKHAYLYLTHFNKNSSTDPLNRDLVRIPVEFFPEEEGANEISWEFETEGDTEAWKEWNQLTPLQVREGHLVTESTGVDPYMISSRFAVAAAKAPVLNVSMKVSSGAWAQVFFITDTDGNYDEAKSLRFPIQGDGEFHTYVLHMDEVNGWNHNIIELRLDPVEVPADIEIDYIRLEGS
jgi:hypothetical protein